MTKKGPTTAWSGL